MTLVSFIVSANPVAKGRPRITTKGGCARAYTPLKTRRYESVVATEAKEAMQSAAPLTGALEMEAHFTLPIPKSWSKRQRQAAVDGLVLPIGKPDADNFLKAVSDALNGIVYVDDGQIVDTRASKRYGIDPGVAITVREVRS